LIFIILQKDGSLVLPRALREEMENTLEDMQKDVPEREKVSLERLADMNPNLLAQIKEAAQTSLSTHSATNGTGGGSTGQMGSGLPDYLIETRSPTSVEQSKAWKAHSMNTFQEAIDATDAISAQLQQIYQGRFTQSEALDMTQYAGTASAVGLFLTKVVDTMKKEEEAEKSKRNILVQESLGFHVDASLFTNDGVKKKNTAVVGSLYEVGLPFQSSADGRRFRTQLELSKHLDALFRQAQLEKTISRAEERGWYTSDAAWQGDVEEPSAVVSADASTSDPAARTAEDDYDPETSTMPADESRDRCAICGLNFKMFFDNEDGIYKYKNCREIEVELDEVALDDSESKFIHVTCWRALGSPGDLTMDQVLQDNVQH
jgi:pre-mRNA cleavage complex 2 protein Pcf11